MWGVLLVTTLAGLATGLGGMLAVAFPPGDRELGFAMGFAAGVMLTVSLGDLLPGAMGWYLARYTPLGAGAALASLLAMGMALAGLLGRCLPEETALQQRGLESTRARALRCALVTGVALLLHNLPEGILTLFTGVADPRMGLRMAVAIALHNLPEGLAVAAPLYYATASRGRAVGAAFASGLAEPLGALLAYCLLARWLTDGFLQGLIVLVAGVMSWVSVAELLPAGFALQSKSATVLGCAVGVCGMALGIACLM